ncbi:cation:proton antiporter domain-containing protein [Streptomyces sp. NPDC054813]
MLGLELVVVLGVAVLVGNVVGQRLGIAPPVVLLVTGVLLGFVPAVREAQLPPEVLLLLFLPVLLYWESLTTSLREIRTNLRGILQLSTVLVILTAWAVAAGHALGLPWGQAWVLGAAMAPTDATAVGVLARALPRRQVTILRAESLVNIRQAAGRVPRPDTRGGLDALPRVPARRAGGRAGEGGHLLAARVREADSDADVVPAPRLLVIAVYAAGVSSARPNSSA